MGSEPHLLPQGVGTQHSAPSSSSQAPWVTSVSCYRGAGEEIYCPDPAKPAGEPRGSPGRGPSTAPTPGELGQALEVGVSIYIFHFQGSELGALADPTLDRARTHAGRGRCPAGNAFPAPPSPPESVGS